MPACWFLVTRCLIVIGMEQPLISPEAPIPVVDIAAIEDRLGGAANVALNIAALGGTASLVAAVGADEAASALRTKLEEAPALPVNLLNSMIGQPLRRCALSARSNSWYEQILKS